MQNTQILMQKCSYKKK